MGKFIDINTGSTVYKTKYKYGPIGLSSSSVDPQQSSPSQPNLGDSTSNLIPSRADNDSILFDDNHNSHRSTHSHLSSYSTHSEDVLCVARKVEHDNLFFKNDKRVLELGNKLHHHCLEVKRLHQSFQTKTDHTDLEMTIVNRRIDEAVLRLEKIHADLNDVLNVTNVLKSVDEGLDDNASGIYSEVIELKNMLHDRLSNIEVSTSSNKTDVCTLYNNLQLCKKDDTCYEVLTKMLGRFALCILPPLAMFTYNFKDEFYR